ncbi:MAG: cytochrome c [Pseudomonadota bacterium]
MRHSRFLTGLILLLPVLLAGCGKETTQPAGFGGLSNTRIEVVRHQDPEQIGRGKAVFRQHCAECHGANGEATPNWRIPGADGRYPPPPLDGSAHAWHHPMAVLRDVIKHGSPNGQGNMPAWEGKLSDREIDDVIAWFQSLWDDQTYAAWHRLDQNARTQM